MHKLIIEGGIYFLLLSLALVFLLLFALFALLMETQEESENENPLRLGPFPTAKK